MAIKKYSGWFDSLRTFLTQYNKPNIPQRQKPTTQPQPVQTAPTGIDLGTKMQIIAQSAKSRTLLFMRYNSNWRYVEPYSYRHKSTGQLLFAFCHKDQHIESFNPNKIEDLQLTEIPFKPRWPVEIAAS
jgi:predicted DNA-binding transcriptional regulator YafY